MSVTTAQEGTTPLRASQGMTTTPSFVGVVSTTVDNGDSMITTTSQVATTMTASSSEAALALTPIVGGQLVLQVANAYVILGDDAARAAFENAMRPEIATAAGNGISESNVEVVVSAPFTTLRRRLEMGVVLAYAIAAPSSISSSVSSVIAKLNDRKPVDFQSYAMSAFQTASSRAPMLAIGDVRGVSIKAVAAVASPTNATSTTNTYVEESETTTKMERIGKIMYLKPNVSIAIVSGGHLTGDTSWFF